MKLSEIKTVTSKCFTGLEKIIKSIHNELIPSKALNLNQSLHINIKSIIVNSMESVESQM